MYENIHLPNDEFCDADMTIKEIFFVLAASFKLLTVSNSKEKQLYTVDIMNYIFKIDVFFSMFLNFIWLDCTKSFILIKNRKKIIVKSSIKISQRAQNCNTHIKQHFQFLHFGSQHQNNNEFQSGLFDD